MEAGLALAIWPVVPGSQREAPGVVAGPEDEDVALAEVHALCLLAGLQLGAPYGFAGLEPFDPAESRNVQQDTPADHPVPVVCDVERRRPLAGEYLLCGMPVVGEAVV